jgi:hypothetical protein
MNETVVYQITQLFRSAYRNTEHVIYSHQNERQAISEFQRLKQNLPDEYFELKKITTIETLIDYTPITDDGWLTARGLRDEE